MKTSIKLADDISSHIVGNDLLLFSEHQQRMFKLNPTAAFIWCCIEEDQNFSEIVQSMIDVFNIEKNAATSDLQNALNEWENSGLLNKNQMVDQTKLKYKQEKLQPVEYSLAASTPTDTSIQRFYLLINTCFLIRFSNAEIENKVLPLFSHLEQLNSQNFDVTLDVIQNGSDFVLLFNGEVLDYCSDKHGIAPMLHANMLMIAYDRSHCLLAIHAGAVSKNNQCILLPAVSGSGKSTLTAALLKEGYQYCTDDLALLSYDEHLIHPVPVSIGLKEGAWPVLASRFPGINNLETHQRADEKMIRYLPPPPDSLPMDRKKGYSVKHIIFPKYQANSVATLSRLSSAEGLCQITEAGYDVSVHLTKQHVEELIEWISDIECYSLTYADLSDATNIIHTLL